MKPGLFPAVVLTALLLCRPVGGAEGGGGPFIGFSSFAGFGRTPGDQPGGTVLTSPVIEAGAAWDELVPSWNLAPAPGNRLKVEVRALYPDHATKYYVMGLYAAALPAAADAPGPTGRQSVKGQQDDDGDVSTDTLVLRKPCRQAQVRLTFEGSAPGPDGLKFFSLSLADRHAAAVPPPGNPAARGVTLRVPERSQMSYPGGNVLCSPTTVSMLLGFWAGELKRPELDHDVPEVQRGVYDAVWKGTGNWSFNMAFAGSQPGLRACVSRFAGVGELEDWIAGGLPVGLSVCIRRLAGKEGLPIEGHLVVCIGFTREGDVILNDPGRSREIHRVIPRQTLLHAWEASGRTVYLVYPENAKLPSARLGHWQRQ